QRARRRSRRCVPSRRSPRCSAPPERPGGPPRRDRRDSRRSRRSRPLCLGVSSASRWDDIQMSEVSLRFVGCGDAFAAGGRFQTSFYVIGGGEPLLIDCGATTLVALKRLGIDPASIGTVVLSHLHGDHFGGLPWLILDGQFAKRTRPLEIIGPPGTTQRVNQAFEALYPGASTAERPFETRFAEFTDRIPERHGPATIT